MIYLTDSAFHCLNNWHLVCILFCLTSGLWYSILQLYLGKEKKYYKCDKKSSELVINCLQTVWCLTKVYSTKKSRFRYSKFKVSYQAAPSGKHGDTLFSLLSTTGQHSFESFKGKKCGVKKGWLVIHVVCTSYWNNIIS